MLNIHFPTRLPVNEEILDFNERSYPKLVLFKYRVLAQNWFFFMYLPRTGTFSCTPDSPDRTWRNWLCPEQRSWRSHCLMQLSRKSRTKITIFKIDQKKYIHMYIIHTVYVVYMVTFNLLVWKTSKNS